MRLKRIMIAAPKSGNGKTIVSCALLLALKERGERVAAFKCGPDYIDPMFHQRVLDVPSKNLDTFFTGEEETKRLFLKDRREEDFALIEGVMGLYDGLGGIHQEGSSYHLAKVTQTPIILVVDAKGMGRSVIAQIAGYQLYDEERLIKGVILNRISAPLYETLKPMLEEQLHIRVVGYLPDCQELHIESRHLGLKLPEEYSDMRKQLKGMSERVKQTVSTDMVAALAGEACPLDTNSKDDRMYRGENTVVKGKPLIAVARDEAFCFYYEDNLRMLQELGARTEYFSPIHDEGLPKGCSGLLLGGGYPELYAEALGRNKKLLAEIRRAVNDQMAVVAECGGFMYLHSAIKDKEGHTYPMAGVLKAQCSYTGKLVRFGYIELEEKQGCFLPAGGTIRGHEFHYYDSTDNGAACRAVKPATGKSYSCVIAGQNVWMGFPHLYYPSNPAFAMSFVKKAGECKSRKGW